MKKSNDTIGNRTRDLLACSVVPQPTAPPRAPHCEDTFGISLSSDFPKLYEYKKQRLTGSIIYEYTDYTQSVFIKYNQLHISANMSS